MSKSIGSSDPSREASRESAAAPHAGCHPHRDAIRLRLEAARSHIDEAIRSCGRRESLGDQVETVAPWNFVPYHRTEIDSLKRLMDHLDRLEARLERIVTPVHRSAESNPLLEIDSALARCAEALVNRFEVPDVRHDLLPDVASDLRQFEQLLDERAQVFPERKGI